MRRPRGFRRENAGDAEAFIRQEIMDNPSRSERSRKAAIQAALTIIARDGPGQLTFDAMSRESGISKGGLMHQFPNKPAVLKALLQHQIEHYEAFFRDYLAKVGDSRAEPSLSAQLAVMREHVKNPDGASLGIVAAVAEDPSLLSIVRETDAAVIKAIKSQAEDPELSLLRWSAARGLVVMTLFGQCPFSDKERDRLFERLLDEKRWTAQTAAKPRRTRKPRRPAA
jgi:AcrR family transcriptional regulator